MTSALHLKRLPRPTPLFQGIRPFPWLAVHPAGHPHEGRPIEREVWCDVPTGEGGGAICGRKFVQQQIDLVWLRRQRPGIQAAFLQQFADGGTDEDGTLWTPTACGPCERRRLAGERPSTPAAGGVARWYDRAPVASRDSIEAGPTQDELFGGLA